MSEPQKYVWTCVCGANGTEADAYEHYCGKHLRPDNPAAIPTGGGSDAGVGETVMPTCVTERDCIAVPWCKLFGACRRHSRALGEQP